MRRTLAAVMTLGLLFAAACGGDGDGGGARPSTDATIEIVEPQAGAKVEGTTVRVRLRLEGGRIVQETSRDVNRVEGHVHVSVDGKVLTQTYGLEQEMDVPEKGRHLLQAEFVAKDHSPFNPRVISSVTFETV